MTPVTNPAAALASLDMVATAAAGRTYPEHTRLDYTVKALHDVSTAPDPADKRNEGTMRAEARRRDSVLELRANKFKILFGRRGVVNRHRLRRLLRLLLPGASDSRPQSLASNLATMMPPCEIYLRLSAPHTPGRRHSRRQT